MDGSAPIFSGSGDSTTNKMSNTAHLNNTVGQLPNGILNTVNGSASASDLGVGTSVTSIPGKKHNQMKDFFLNEEPGYEVIKEEKHQKNTGNSKTASKGCK